jgi:hypothetical protein
MLATMLRRRRRFRQTQRPRSRPPRCAARCATRSACGRTGRRTGALWLPLCKRSGSRWPATRSCEHARVLVEVVAPRLLRVMKRPGPVRSDLAVRMHFSAFSSARRALRKAIAHQLGFMHTDACTDWKYCERNGPIHSRAVKNKKKFSGANSFSPSFAMSASLPTNTPYKQRTFGEGPPISPDELHLVLPLLAKWLLLSGVKPDALAKTAKRCAQSGSLDAPNHVVSCFAVTLTNSPPRERPRTPSNVRIPVALSCCSVF